MVRGGRGVTVGGVLQVGILVTGASSGAHMNPAVSVAMGVWGRWAHTGLFTSTLQAASVRSACLPPGPVPGGRSVTSSRHIMSPGAASAVVLTVFQDSVGEVGAQVS